MSQLDESTLKKVTLMTGGHYYRVTPDETELEAIYKDIRKMEQKELASKQFTQYEDRYQIFLLIAIIILFVEALLSDRRKIKDAPTEGSFAQI